MNRLALKAWNGLSVGERQEIFLQVSAEKGIPPAAVEKDWWVLRTLELVFQTSIAPHTVFKGGTSLSKAWGLIERFSEDIDLAMDPNEFGVPDPKTVSQVNKLRKRSFQYFSETFLPELRDQFLAAAFADVTLGVIDTRSDGDDPVKIEVKYPAITEPPQYLEPRVLIEIGSRSLREPLTERSCIAFVDEHFHGRAFAFGPVAVPAVNPERTFLEKIFLLHEKYQKPNAAENIKRVSRHLYDLEKLMDTEYARIGLTSKELYFGIVEHRKQFTAEKHVDYANHTPEKIRIVPPEELIAPLQEDFNEMRESMIYKEPLSFDALLARVSELNERIHNIQFE